MTGLSLYYPDFFKPSSYEKVSVAPYKYQKFAIGHEFGHYLLGHAEPARRDAFIIASASMTLEALRGGFIKQECEASVVAVQLAGDDAKEVLRAIWEYVKRDKKALSEYDLSYQRAILVLEGQQQSCGE